ncbi:Uncharacterised protein [Yersinia mollaretii]|uniref:hypothetical protein n=1 Tax=Yersinia mollaretii TaxID=33060 RepID=UPI0005E891DD|nr:hypothetical protein [Yersinia mollaretii]CNK68604.1 Uncharacterised protein [Yersinia mollaretii]
MALVINMKAKSRRALGDGDGFNHLVGTNHDTLCGWCDAGEWSDVFSGEITCPQCKKEALKVFQSCKKSEVV